MSGTDYAVMWCVQEEVNPQSDYTLRFLSSYNEFMSCGFYVVLAGKYLPMFCIHLQGIAT